MQLLSSLPVWWLVLCLLIEPQWWHHQLFKFLGDAKYSKGKAALIEANFVEFSANAGLALLQTLPESKLKNGFFNSMMGVGVGSVDFFCRWVETFVLFVWWLQCLACLLSVWRGSWKGEGVCSILWKWSKFGFTSWSLEVRLRDGFLNSDISFLVLSLCQDKQSSLF